MCCMACILYNDVGIGFDDSDDGLFFPLLYLTQKVAIFIVSLSLVLMRPFGGCQNSAFMIAPNCLHDRNDTNSDSLKRRWLLQHTVVEIVIGQYFLQNDSIFSRQNKPFSVIITPKTQSFYWLMQVQRSVYSNAKHFDYKRICQS